MLAGKSSSSSEDTIRSCPIPVLLVICSSQLETKGDVSEVVWLTCRTVEKWFFFFFFFRTSFYANYNCSLC